MTERTNTRRRMTRRRLLAIAMATAGAAWAWTRPGSRRRIQAARADQASTDRKRPRWIGHA